MTKHNLFVQEVVAIDGTMLDVKHGSWNTIHLLFSLCGHQGNFIIVESIVNDARLVA